MVSTANRPRPQRPPREAEDPSGFSERVVYTRRIAKVVKGGRRLRFNALVVVGDSMGNVGAGMGKALVIPDAVRKGNAIARREMVKIPIKGSTIPHEITVKVGASIVVLKPAPEGTGIIAAGAMRAILELGGVRDVVGKSLGSRNPINTVQATLEALRRLRNPHEEVAKRMAAKAQMQAQASRPQGRQQRSGAGGRPMPRPGQRPMPQQRPPAAPEGQSPQGQRPQAPQEGQPAAQPQRPMQPPAAQPQQQPVPVAPPQETQPPVSASAPTTPQQVEAPPQVTQQPAQPPEATPPQTPEPTTPAAE